MPAEGSSFPPSLGPHLCRLWQSQLSTWEGSRGFKTRVTAGWWAEGRVSVRGDAGTGTRDPGLHKAGVLSGHLTSLAWPLGSNENLSLGCQGWSERLRETCPPGRAVWRGAEDLEKGARPETGTGEHQACSRALPPGHSAVSLGSQETLRVSFGACVLLTQMHTGISRDEAAPSSLWCLRTALLGSPVLRRPPRGVLEDWGQPPPGARPLSWPSFPARPLADVAGQQGALTPLVHFSFAPAPPS